MSNPVIVIGGGVSGLVACIELERRNIPYLLIEQDSVLGGRVVTDKKDGFLLDRGFQVLQTAYPEAKHYLDYEKLNLKKFKPGAKIYSNGQWNTISDPFRDFGAFFETLFSGIGTILDKWLVLKLRNEVKGMNTDLLFNADQQSTNTFLKEFGFSDAFIEQFFQPFFSGIFLEQELSTSADVFKFIYKMFTEGEAAIPALGIGEISKQLVAQLDKNSIRLQTKVSSVENSKVYLDDGTSLDAKAIILAGSGSLIKTTEEEQWNGTDCVYMLAPTEIRNQSYLLLNSRANRLINNIAFISDIAPDYAPENARLVSISLAKISELNDRALELELARELNELFGNYSWKWIQRYSIPYSLPVRKQVQKSSIKLNESTFLAGDTNYFGSLNFAMKSGREAVEVLG